MTLLGVPAAQLLPVFAAGSAVLGVLYLLRQRRRRLEVPFARLWQKVLRQTEATSLWQHLKRWLSLLLQILILGLLLLALGDPRLLASQRGRTLVLVLDASASMQALLDDGNQTLPRTRMDQARQEAALLIRDLAGDDTAVVVALHSQPAPMGGLSQDERELLAQVDAVTAKDGPADLPRGLRLAADLLRGRKNPQIVLLSDGGFDPGVLPAGMDLRYVPVGTPGEGNVAITSFAVRRYRHNRLSYEVLVELSYFPAAETDRAQVPVKLELQQEGETVDVKEVSLAPGERLQRIYPNLSGSGAHLTARLSRKAGRDTLPLDNQAYALLPERRRQRVLVVTRGNLFLEGALLSASAGDENQLEITKVAPAAYDSAKVAAFDAVIFDAFTPPSPKAAHAIYLDPQGEASPFAIAEAVTTPYLSDTAKEHPVLRWVTLTDLNVSRASVFRLAHGDVALASMLRKPIIVARERREGGAQRRSLAVGFDLRRSDLPLRVAFPVLLFNALDWFAGDADAMAGSFVTGRTWRIQTDVRPPILTLPDGERIELPVDDSGGAGLYHGVRVGFYELLRPGAAPLLLAANLADAAESAARVRQQLIGPDGKPLPPPERGRSAIRRVLWPYLLLVAFLLLCLEWWSYQRRWTV